MATPVNPKYPLFLRDIDKDCDSVGGYPVVIVEGNFNIEAKANVFYDIKNNADNDINITFIRKENVIGEYVFNINSPANIIFNEEIKWNNDNLPDLQQEGVCTISILNDVACYTFVNS